VPVAAQPQPEEDDLTWPVERKIGLVLEERFDREPVVEICRKAGISMECYCRWRQQFIDAARFGMAHPQAVYEADDPARLEERVRQLEMENASLRQQVQTLRELCTLD
jgi:transposase-like protein